VSVYRQKDRAFYVYEFVYRGVRFRGSTGATTKREAEAVERRERHRAEREHRARIEAGRAFTGEAPLTLGVATARWWQEVGAHHAASDTTWANLERMVDWFGAGRRLDQITDADVSAWVAARRGETIKGRRALKDGSPAPLVKPATVNRTTVDALRKLYARARRSWKIGIPSEPDWRAHRLKEAGERVAELQGEHQPATLAAMGEGYRDAVAFAIASGLRLGNVASLEWAQVEWGDGVTDKGRVRVVQKGERVHVVPMSADMRAILSACRGHDARFVFTYVLRRRSARLRLAKGARAPVTYHGLQIEARRVFSRLGLPLRFHDLRHTLGTRIVRATGNLKAAQKALGHARIDTTAAFYAHAMEDDVRAAMDATPRISPRATDAGTLNPLKKKNAS
jgi:site-specific recombinase XerD